MPARTLHRSYGTPRPYSWRMTYGHATDGECVLGGPHCDPCFRIRPLLEGRSLIRLRRWEGRDLACVEAAADDDAVDLKYSWRGYLEDDELVELPRAHGGGLSQAGGRRFVRIAWAGSRRGTSVAASWRSPTSPGTAATTPPSGPGPPPARRPGHVLGEQGVRGRLALEGDVSVTGLADDQRVHLVAFIDG